MPPRAPPAVCPWPDCGREYATKRDLQRHQLSHGAPQFACNTPGCDRKFYRRDALLRHQRNKTWFVLVPSSSLLHDALIFPSRHVYHVPSQRNSARRLARRDKGEEVDEAEEPNSSAPDSYVENAAHTRRPQRCETYNIIPPASVLKSICAERTASSRRRRLQEGTLLHIDRLCPHCALTLYMRATMMKTKRTRTILTFPSHEDRPAPSDLHTSAIIDTQGLTNRHRINLSPVLQSPPVIPTTTLLPAMVLPRYVPRTLILHPPMSLRHCMIIIFMGQCILLCQRVCCNLVLTPHTRKTSNARGSIGGEDPEDDY